MWARGRIWIWFHYRNDSRDLLPADVHRPIRNSVTGDCHVRCPQNIGIKLHRKSLSSICLPSISVSIVMSSLRLIRTNWKSIPVSDLAYRKSSQTVDTNDNRLVGDWAASALLLLLLRGSLMTPVCFHKPTPSLWRDHQETDATASPHPTIPPDTGNLTIS